jgi:hypothetical protein
MMMLRSASMAEPPACFCGVLVEEETTTIRVGSVLLGQFQLSIDENKGLLTTHLLQPHSAQSPKTK